MASENGRLPEEQSNRTGEHRNVPQKEQETATALADSNPASRSDGGTNDKYNKWSNGLKNALRKTQVTDWLIVLFTGVLAFYTAKLAEVANRTDDAVHEANLLNAGINHPWVRADISPIQLEFERHGNQYGAALTTLITVNNSGQFPANSAYINPAIILDIGQPNNDIEVIKSRCVNRKAINGLTLGQALFRDSPHTERHIAPVENVSFESPFTAWFLVCITYDVPLIKGTGRTGYLFSVARRDDNHPGARFSFTPGAGPFTPPALDLIPLASYAE